MMHVCSWTFLTRIHFIAPCHHSSSVPAPLPCPALFHSGLTLAKHRALHFSSPEYKSGYVFKPVGSSDLSRSCSFEPCLQTSSQLLSPAELVSVSFSTIRVICGSVQATEGRSPWDTAFQLDSEPPEGAPRHPACPSPTGKDRGLGHSARGVLVIFSPFISPLSSQTVRWGLHPRLLGGAEGCALPGSRLPPPELGAACPKPAALRCCGQAVTLVYKRPCVSTRGRGNPVERAPPREENAEGGFQRVLGLCYLASRIDER